MYEGFNASGGLWPSVCTGLNALAENFVSESGNYGIIILSGPLDFYGCLNTLPKVGGVGVWGCGTEPKSQGDPKIVKRGPKGDPSFGKKGTQRGPFLT